MYDDARPTSATGRAFIPPYAGLAYKKSQRKITLNLDFIGKL
jgi:hypothetical protein